MSNLLQRAKTIQRTPYNFALHAGGIELRPYQLEPIQAIWNSIKSKSGLTFVVIISRQSGKDELLCHLKIYLMHRYQSQDMEIVEFNPTYKPQTIRARLRLEDRMQSNILTRNRWKKNSDFMRMIGQAKTTFLSGDGKANVVGATASLLLIINEAQDISPFIYDKRCAPMAASNNATRVLIGTAWTSHSLLAREYRSALNHERQDGIRRTFAYTADDVRKHNKQYGIFVDAEIARLGRQHPLIKTQYFNEVIDSQAGMFNATRRALMIGDWDPQDKPVKGHTYAFLIDVAGQDEARMLLNDNAPLDNPGRDSTTLSIIDIDLSSLESLNAPTYRVVKRISWLGEGHVKIFGALSSMIDSWKPLYVIEDKTGVGEGLYGMLFRKYESKTIGIQFSSKVKSEMGYRFLAIIETGRFRDCASSTTVELQYQNTHSEILPGPQKTMRWSVPEGTRDQASGELIHDDHVIADSMVSFLDDMHWITSSKSTIIQRNIQLEIDGTF